jgi:glucose-6-phosphate dehydrogenase assembly protein OpcA
MIQSEGESPRKHVDPNAIERGLTELLATDQEGETPVTKAALWNVVAHTESDVARDHAGAVLAEASKSVPHRSILIRSAPTDADSFDSWISANCHEGPEGQQICSEQITIAAGGERIFSVPSLVQALLIPDMPVAAWWLGDLPNEREAYVESLLEPADRLIVDSIHFDSPADLSLVIRLGKGTDSLPADLNWMRLDEWRLATASMFDPSAMRQRLAHIRSVRLVSAADGSLFGQSVAALYFAAWLASRLGQTLNQDASVVLGGAAISYDFEQRTVPAEAGALGLVEITFDDGTRMAIERSTDLRVLRGSGTTSDVPSTVTPILALESSELIVRQLSHQDEDHVFSRILPMTTILAQRI